KSKRQEPRSLSIARCPQGTAEGLLLPSVVEAVRSFARGAIMESMQNILPVLCFIAGFGLAWLIWHGRSAARAADLQARLETERKSADEKMALLEDTRQKLSDAFKALSADALARNSQSFLELAGATLAKTQETARGDLELRQQAIADMVAPVRESLDKVDHKIQELEKARAAAGAKSSCAASWKWPACWSIATLVRSPRSSARRAACDPTCWSSCPPARPSWWMPRRRSRATSKPSRRPTRQPARPVWPITRARCAST